MTEPAFLLDSNICVYVLVDAQGLAARRLAECEVGTVVTSAIAYAEVMRGIPNDDIFANAGADALFDVVPVLPFGDAAARRYRDIQFKRGTFDRLIAAHALALGVTLVTNNARDYTDVAELRVENWTLP